MKKLIQCTKPFLLMMLFTLTLFVLLLTPTLTQAQISASYNFANSTGTYTPITGGTVLGIPAQDDEEHNGLILPFQFSFSGATMTHFAVTSNGFMTLAGSSATAVQQSYDVFASGDNTNTIAAFSDDLRGSPTGELSYTTLGVTPNRTLVIQWKDYGKYAFSGATASYNFQVRLSETSNVINIVYGAFTAVQTDDAQIGLGGSSATDFNIRATATDWSATAVGTLDTDVCLVSSTIFPTVGQTYTYTPTNTPCVALGGTNVTNLNSTSVTLNWTSMPLATLGYNVEYRLSSTAPAGAFTPAAGNPFAGTSANITGLALSTDYQWRVQSICAGPITSTFTSAFYQNEFSTLSNCALPTTLAASAITTTSVTLSWVGNLTASLGYTLEYKEATSPTYTSIPIAAGVNTTTISSLTLATNYQWRITSNCTGTPATATTTVQTFATACNPASIPYNESFESIVADGDLPVCMATSDVDACVTYAGPQTFPTRTARTGTKFASYDTGFGNIPAGGAYFYSAPLQLSAGQNYKFSVWYITDGASVWDVLEASFGTNQSPVGLTVIPGASVTLPTNTTYQELTGIFTAPTTGSYYVALRCVSSEFFANLDIDDFSVIPPPACIAPIGVVTSAITTTTATVSWGAVAGSTGYNVQYRTIGAPAFTAFAGNPVVGATANLTGLSASSTYEIQVQNKCSTPLTSAFSNLVNFNTVCGTITSFPYEEGFEGISVNDELPNCMAKSSATICKTYTSAPGSFNRIPRTGNKFGAFRYGTATGGDYFYSAALQLTAGKSYKFSVWYTTDGSTSWGTLDAYVGNAQTPAGLVAIPGASVVAPSSLAYSELTGTLTVPSTGVYYVALRCATPSTLPDYLSFDDLSVSFPCANVVFAPAALPSGDLTTAYNQTIAATGGTAPYVYSVSAGVIPAGLTFNTATGVISGTPTATSITPPTFTIKVTDATGCSTFKTYSIPVTAIPCATITITPTSLPAGTIGVLYPPTAVQFVATGIAGATYSYSVVAGNLPSGMTLTATGANAGRLTGTPTTRTTAPITIRARIAVGPSAGCFGTVTINFVVNCSPMTLTPAITDAVINIAYSQQLTAGGGGTTGSFTYAVTTGTLPVGFSLSAGGILSGNSAVLSIPTSITITATRTNGCDISQTYTFGVVPVIAAPVQLNPIQISSGSFRARWEPVARAVKYRVYVATSNSFDGGSFATGYIGLAVVQDTSILVQNLKPETKYYIQITAISSADEISPYSNLKDATTLSAVTGIDNALSSQVKVSPNPSKDKFLIDFGTLNLGKTTARVYDAQGKQVFSSEISANVNQTTIPLGNMANGIYLLEIISSKGRILKRLVKE